mmetsp:Transcript_23083/g.64414  ORF Transcript_23083/g.64414 Transcript_23083/m.64414 type:complete len:113 (+) Transcript_23083:785-1123(+)
MRYDLFFRSGTSSMRLQDQMVFRTTVLLEHSAIHHASSIIHQHRRPRFKPSSSPHLFSSSVLLRRTSGLNEPGANKRLMPHGYRTSSTRGRHVKERRRTIACPRMFVFGGFL